MGRVARFFDSECKCSATPAPARRWHATAAHAVARYDAARFPTTASAALAEHHNGEFLPYEHIDAYVGGAASAAAVDGALAHPYALDGPASDVAADRVFNEGAFREFQFSAREFT